MLVLLRRKTLTIAAASSRLFEPPHTPAGKGDQITGLPSESTLPDERSEPCLVLGVRIGVGSHRVRKWSILGLFVISLAGVNQVAAGTTHSAGPSFSGNGGKSVPPFQVSAPSTIVWSASGGLFSLLSAGLSGGDVNSQAASGWTYLPPGRYQYSVNAVGSWKFRVVTGVIRPKPMAGGFLSYSGNGGMSLPPFHMSSGTLHWSATGGLFSLLSSGLSGGDVNSQGRSGTT